MMILLGVISKGRCKSFWKEFLLPNHFGDYSFVKGPNMFASFSGSNIAGYYCKSAIVPNLFPVLCYVCYG